MSTQPSASICAGLADLGQSGSVPICLYSLAFNNSLCSNNIKVPKNNTRSINMVLGRKDKIFCQQLSVTRERYWMMVWFQLVWTSALEIFWYLRIFFITKTSNEPFRSFHFSDLLDVLSRIVSFLYFSVSSWSHSRLLLLSLSLLNNIVQCICT